MIAIQAMGLVCLPIVVELSTDHTWEWSDGNIASYRCLDNLSLSLVLATFINS